MGIIAPTVIFGLLFVYPYLDLTPSRRYAHRRIALTFCMLFLLGWTITTYMGTPFYGVETSGDVEVAQELIPQEGVGPVRAVPYDEWHDNLTVFDKDNTIWVTEVDTLKATEGAHENYDSIVAPRSIEITEDEVIRPDPVFDENGVLVRIESSVIPFDDLEEEFEDAPELVHVIEEFHHLLYDEYGDNLDDAKGYLSISENQDNLVRVYLLITWLGETEEGDIQRKISGKTVQIHKESEWHEH